MKIRFLLAALILGVSLVISAAAQDTTSPAEELKALVADVTGKIRTGERSAAALAPELARFDALLAKYAGNTSDDVAQIALMKAMLFIQVLDQENVGRAQLQAIKRDYPESRAAAGIDRMLEQLDRTAKAKAAQAGLVGNSAPEIRFTWSDKGNLSTLSALKGKVVVLDFWATWCGPCVASFPQVRELAAHYKDSPVEVIGVTSLQGRVHGLEPKPIDVKDDPAREMALMHDYMKAKDITWTVAFSEENVFNPDYGIQGIPYVAIIAPDGTVRYAGLHPASPLADKTSKIDAILREFGLPVPKA